MAKRGVKNFTYETVVTVNHHNFWIRVWLGWLTPPGKTNESDQSSFVHRTVRERINVNLVTRERSFGHQHFVCPEKEWSDNQWLAETLLMEIPQANAIEVGIGGLQHPPTTFSVIYRDWP